MSGQTVLTIRPPGAAPLDDLATVPLDEFRSWLIEGAAAGGRIVALFGMEPWVSGRTGGAAGPVAVVGAMARPGSGELDLCTTEIAGGYDAVTPACTQAHRFERELAEEWGVVPEGHPWLKPVRFAPPRRGGTSHAAGMGVTDFFRIEGAEVHEVAVGPVHAGVIEPGHFRFQCNGEMVYHLEISLGYQHRGAEIAMEGGPTSRSLHLSETMAGDTSIGHATAYCSVVESLAGVEVPERAATLRALALELERIAAHIGDLGALAGDVGFLPTAAYCGRIRGDALNATALLCGNRFGRSLVVPGGVAFDADDALRAELRRRIEGVRRDARSACDLLWKTPAVVARFEGTGPLTAELATEIGLVGPAARACGLRRDARLDHPGGWFVGKGFDPSLAAGGDVLARARVRWLEVEGSAAMAARMLDEIDGAGPSVAAPMPVPRPRSIAVALVEGWRGEICHVAVTGGNGLFARYKVVDPSFHNWFGLACAMRGQQISDFPLCNKSFNLSYCGHDL